MENGTSAFWIGLFLETSRGPNPRDHIFCSEIVDATVAGQELESVKMTGADRDCATKELLLE